MLIAIFALSAANASAAPTMSSMAGTYVEKTSSGTGYNIILYANGTALFSSYSGTWHLVNSTTFEGIYQILFSTQDDYFKITNNGFTAVQTGNVYVKTSNSTPNIPEFSSVALISVAAAMTVVTLGAVVLTKKPRKQLRK